MTSTLITSLGNPGATYASTLHSAGHVLLAAMIRHTGSPPPMRQHRHAQALVSHHEPTDTTFWESPTYMNQSGPALASAWQRFVAEREGRSPALVILHDDLDAMLGTFKIRKNVVGASAKGHNGLKSVLSQRGMMQQKITRVGLGIGPRPASKQSDDVAAFVLSKMTPREMAQVERLAGPVWNGLGLAKMQSDAVT